MPLLPALLKDGVISLDDDVEPKTKFYARPLKRQEQLIYLHTFTPDGEDPTVEAKSEARADGMDWTFENQISKVENAAFRVKDKLELRTLTDPTEIQEYIAALSIGEQLEIDNKISDLNTVSPEVKKRLLATSSAPE